MLARAFDRGHLYELKEAGADFVVSETYQSALALGGEALRRSGTDAARVEELMQYFSAIEQKHFDKLLHSWRGEGSDVGFGDHFFSLFMQIEEELIKTMRRDRLDSPSEPE